MRKALVLATTTLLSVLHFSAARLCCKEGVYSLTINLEQTCANSKVEGFTPVEIVETSCMTTILPPFEEQGILLERVRRVDIYEVGSNFGLLAHQIIPGPLADGAVIEYESVVGQGGPSPNGIQVAVTAETSDGVSVMNLWTITYENSCILPLFAPGATIGWTGVAITCTELTSGTDGDENPGTDQENDNTGGEGNENGDGQGNGEEHGTDPGSNPGSDYSTGRDPPNYEYTGAKGSKKKKTTSLWGDQNK